MNDTPRSILITGACGDIGLALATEFAAGGPVRLALCDLLPAGEAERCVAPLRNRGATVLYQPVDVADPQAVERFVDEADRTLGGMDICICNAGIVERGELIDLS